MFSRMGLAFFFLSFSFFFRSTGLGRLIFAEIIPAFTLFMSLPAVDSRCKWEGALQRLPRLKFLEWKALSTSS